MTTDRARPGARDAIAATFCAAALALAPVRAAAAPGEARTLSVTCRFEAPRLSPAAGGLTRVAVRGCAADQRVGKPSLPFRTVRMLLPPSSEVAGVSAHPEADPVVVDGRWVVEFGRTPMPLGGASPASAAEDAPDPAVYQSAGRYPGSLAELVSVQRMAGWDIAVLRVFPLQYEPPAGRLVFAPAVRIDVALAPLTRESAAAPRPIGPSRRAADRLRVAAFVDNPETLAQGEDEPGESAAASSASADYLLITKAALAPAFQPLLDRKIAGGLTVETETIETIAAGFAGRDLAEKVRACIRGAYAARGIRYVLLGGDVSTVPCRYAYADMNLPEADSLLPCDLYFACLDGSWNRDGDSRWGEPTDGDAGGDVDLLAEVFVGRAPVDTAAEAAAFVEKAVRYEETAGGNTGDVLLAGAYLGYYDPPGAPPPVHAQGGDMFDPMLPQFVPYALAWLDDRPYTTPQWTDTDAIAALNRSPQAMLYGGHGDVDSMMRMTVEALDTVTNAAPFLAYSVSCNAGEFDNPSFLSDCIGEEFVKRPLSGAFAGVFNSRVGWFDPQEEWTFSGEFQIAFYTELLSRAQVNLGAANQLAKHDMIGQVETSGIMPYRWCYYEINALGDPHVPVLPNRATFALTVASDRGGGAPPAGIHRYPYGTAVTCAVTNSPVGGGTGTQYRCAGWSGGGSVPAAGADPQVAFVISNDSHIAWNWTTQFLLSATAAAHGSVAASNGWHDAGTTGVLVEALSDPYYHFDRWEGDAPAGQTTDAVLQVTMDRPRALSACFAENATSRGTPEWWLAQYGWTNEFEAAAGSDTDADGLAAWEEYVAETVPTNAASVFAVTLTFIAGPGSDCVLQWPSASNRLYAVERAAAMAGPFVRVAAELAATPPVNTFTDGDRDPVPRFYRVVVWEAL